jgi:peptidoglycan LD-endopeptidase LytH
VAAANPFASVVLALAVAASAAAAGLDGKRLRFPLPAAHEDGLRDSFHEKRGARAHEAVDIMAPRGTPVHAVEDGRVAKLFTSVPGGKTIYQFDPSGRYAYYYAHLDRYAKGLADGSEVRRGEVIGYVGSSGNAAPGAPHLHFAIFRLGPKREWWKGEPVDPYPLLASARRKP